MLTPVQRVLILKYADLLREVGPRHLLELAEVGREVELNAGDAIYEQEDIAAALFMVVEGRVRLSAGDRVISEVGPGEAFGTWALVDDSARGQRAECIEDGLALALHRDAFYDVAAGDLTLLQEVVRVLAKRLREVVSRPEEARVEGEGIAKPEALAAEEAAALEAAEIAEPATAGTALAAAALGQTSSDATPAKPPAKPPNPPIPTAEAEEAGEEPGPNP